MYAKPLPAHDSPEIRTLGWNCTSDHYKAYSAILATEKYAQELVDDASTIERSADRNSALECGMDKLISARVAGRFLIEFEEQSAFFKITPAETLVKLFLSAQQDPLDGQHDVVIDNGRNLRDNFIRAFRTPSFPYRPILLDPSRSPTGDHCTSSRNKALARDGFRCIVTGIYDQTSLINCPPLADITKVLHNCIQTAYIFHEPMIEGIEPENEDSKVYKTYHTANAMSIFESFGFSKFVDTFGQTDGVHEVWNMISLTPELYFHFNRFNVWFEPTQTPHRYRIGTLYDSHKRAICVNFEGQDRAVEGAPMVVEFDSQNRDVPPPDPLLLALHALCARVAHASGAIDFFERLERDVEKRGILASDRSSGLLLNHILSPHSTHILVGA